VFVSDLILGLHFCSFLTLITYSVAIFSLECFQNISHNYPGWPVWWSFRTWDSR